MNYQVMHQRVVLVMIAALEEYLLERKERGDTQTNPPSRQELKAILKAKIARKIVEGELYRIPAELTGLSLESSSPSRPATPRYRTPPRRVSPMVRPSVMPIRPKPKSVPSAPKQPAVEPSISGFGSAPGAMRPGPGATVPKTPPQPAGERLDTPRPWRERND